jgi:hypothetical protein
VVLRVRSNYERSRMEFNRKYSVQSRYTNTTCILKIEIRSVFAVFYKQKFQLILYFYKTKAIRLGGEFKSLYRVQSINNTNKMILNVWCPKPSI